MTDAPSEDTFTQRGFRHTLPVKGTYGGKVKVYESSAASEPHVWVAAEDADGHEVCVHLTIDDAVSYATNILRVCQMHYQLRWAAEEEEEEEARDER